MTLAQWMLRTWGWALTSHGLYCNDRKGSTHLLGWRSLIVRFCIPRRRGD